MRCSSSWMISVGRQQACAVPTASSRPPGFGGAVEAPFVLAVDVAEEGAGLADPRQAGELVDRRDQEGRQAAVDRLVHRQHRQRPVAGEVAGGVGAADLHVLRRRVVRRAGEAVPAERRAAPRAGLDRRRRLAAVLAGSAGPARPRCRSRRRRSCRAGWATPPSPTQSPISIGQSPSSACRRPRPGRLAAHQLQRADDAGGAGELVEREQPQRVAHQHRDAGAERAAIGDAADGRSSRRRGRDRPPSCRRRSGRTADPTISRSACSRSAQAAQVQQDEGELERPPARRAPARPDRRRVRRCAGARRGRPPRSSPERRGARGDRSASSAMPSAIRCSRAAPPRRAAAPSLCRGGPAMPESSRAWSRSSGSYCAGSPSSAARSASGPCRGQLSQRLHPELDARRSLRSARPARLRPRQVVG